MSNNKLYQQCVEHIFGIDKRNKEVEDMLKGLTNRDYSRCQYPKISQKDFDKNLITIIPEKVKLVKISSEHLP